MFTRGVEDGAHANRVDQFDWTEVPAKPPSQHAVHVVERVRDIRSYFGGVDERWRQRGAKELADAVAAVEQGS